MANERNRSRKAHQQGDARKAALDALVAWSINGGPVDPLLLEKCGGLHDPRDFSLARTIVIGVLQQKISLDYILQQFANQPLHRYKRIVRYALRIGLYQLFFLDRIPGPAAINETVACLKKSGQPRQILGLVNGVLRNILRRQEEGNWRPLASAPPEVRLNHPPWLLDRWLLRYGEQETESLCLCNNTPPDLVLRVNTGKIDRQTYLALLHEAGITAAEGEYAPEAVRLDEYRGSLEKVPGYAQGYFQVQDEGAQLISHLLTPLSGSRYLDACAGLGGKTSHLAQMLPPAAKLDAVEPDARRRKLLGENMDRLGLRPVDLFEGTLEEFVGQKGQEAVYAGILLDVPCSGLGVIRRHPEIRWNRQPQDLARYQKLQLELLRTAARLLVPEGVLVYATCSTEPEENEEVIRNFLAETMRFRIDNAAKSLPAVARPLVTEEGFLQTKPELHGTDGFFAVRLQRHPA